MKNRYRNIEGILLASLTVSPIFRYVFSSMSARTATTTNYVQYTYEYLKYFKKCSREREGSEKIERQRAFPSLLVQFSDGKLKQDSLL
jgi:hypothetical protein